MTAVADRRWTAPRATLVAIAAAWALAIVSSLTGAGRLVHHEQLIEGGPPLGAAVALFLVAWPAHVTAMMLPSSLPLITLFDRVAAGQPRFVAVRTAFLSGYGAVWTALGVLAFGLDIPLHYTVERWPWLSEREWLLGGSVLVLGGLFQFSTLKDRCLRECRHPGGFIIRHYRHGVAAAFALGLRHGMVCLGCCWALMLVLFAVGIANLAWMAPLALVMFYEKAAPRGERAVAPVGVVLLALGALVLAHPGWLPEALLGG